MADAVLELVAEDGRRFPLDGELTIGRGIDSSLRIEDPSVSRTHARVHVDVAGAALEDAGSSHGTFLDGHRVSGPAPLLPGGRIQLGNRVLVVEQRVAATPVAADAEDVPFGTIVIGAIEPEAPLGAAVATATRVGMRPRLREGVKLKRMPEAEGTWLVQDPVRHDFVRVDDGPGALLPLLNGGTTLTDLVAAAEAQMGPDGLGRLARLLAELGERGLLADVLGGREAAAGPVPAVGWRTWVQPREKPIEGWARAASGLYAHGGRLLLSRAGLALLAGIIVGGFIAAVAVVVGRYGTPFVVASHLGLGGVVFVASRGFIVVIHEAAHALVLGSYGRTVKRAGLRLVFVFPYTFVDTSESLFEPKRRRMAVAAAGPAADLVCGGAFAIACLGLPGGTLRDICFQVAFAAYIGALFNLNPFLDRDGYGLIVDALGEPGLRRRARAQLARRMAGRGRAEDDPVLTRYAIASLGWMVCGVGLGVVMTLRFRVVMEHYADPLVVRIVLGTLWTAMLLPVLIVIVKPLLQRRREAT